MYSRGEVGSFYFLSFYKKKKSFLGCTVNHNIIKCCKVCFTNLNVITDCNHYVYQYNHTDHYFSTICSPVCPFLYFILINQKPNSSLCKQSIILIKASMSWSVLLIYINSHHAMHQENGGATDS